MRTKTQIEEIIKETRKNHIEFSIARLNKINDYCEELFDGKFVLLAMHFFSLIDSIIALNPDVTDKEIFQMINIIDIDYEEE